MVMIAQSRSVVSQNTSMFPVYVKMVTDEAECKRHLKKATINAGKHTNKTLYHKTTVCKSQSSEIRIWAVLQTKIARKMENDEAKKKSEMI